MRIRPRDWVTRTDKRSRSFLFAFPFSRELGFSRWSSCHEWVSVLLIGAQGKWETDVMHLDIIVISLKSSSLRERITVPNCLFVQQSAKGKFIHWMYVIFGWVRFLLSDQPLPMERWKYPNGPSSCLGCEETQYTHCTFKHYWTIRGHEDKTPVHLYGTWRIIHTHTSRISHHWIYGKGNSSV